MKANVERKLGFWEKVFMSKDNESIITSGLDRLDPNGKENGMLTGCAAFDNFGKFCGQLRTGP